MHEVGGHAEGSAGWDGVGFVVADWSSGRDAGETGCYAVGEAEGYGEGRGSVG